MFILKNNNRGFTLIELLMVIAIVSLMSSIVFASLNDAREKARMAAGLQFSSSLYHTLGSEVAGIWNLDDGSGSSASDTSGYSNNGTLMNNPSWSNDIPGKNGSSLSFDGTNDYINIGIRESLQMRDGSVTVEFWIKPNTWAGGYRGLFVGSAGGGLQGYGVTLHTNGTKIVGEIYGSLGGRQLVSRNIGIKIGEWNHIAIVFEGENNFIQGFLNGNEKFKVSINDPGSVVSTSGFFIGSHVGSSWFYNGLMDDIRVYKRALTEAEIMKAYAQNLQTYKEISYQK